jgi:hypothetical protein
VLLFSAEDGAADTIRPRLESMGAELQRVELVEAARGEDGKEHWPSLVEDLLYIEHKLAGGGYGLVILDPVNAYLRGIDGNRDIDLRSAPGPLAKLAETYRVAIIIIRHLTKSSRDRAIYRGAGGIGYTGVGRIEWLVGRNPDDQAERVVAVIKNNLAPEPPNMAFEITEGRFLWRGETDVTAAQMLEPDGKGGTTKLDDAITFLETVLGDGEEHASKPLIDEAVSIGISRETIFRAKKGMDVAAIRHGIEGKRGAGEWFWRLRVSRVSKENFDTLNPPQIQNGHQPSEELAPLINPGLCPGGCGKSQPYGMMCTPCRARTATRQS